MILAMNPSEIRHELIFLWKKEYPYQVRCIPQFYQWEESVIPTGQIQLDLPDHPKKAKRYAEQMRNGDIFPPIVVLQMGDKYQLVDGFHRCWATRVHNGQREIRAYVGYIPQ